MQMIQNACLMLRNFISALILTQVFSMAREKDRWICIQKPPDL
jgi:hypothetical protein